MYLSAWTNVFVQKLENALFFITWGRECTLKFYVHGETKLSWVVRYDASDKEFPQDLMVLNQWAKQWQASFKVEKCKLMHPGKIIETTYV